MKAQFEVWEYDFPVKGLHPVVLISPPDRCAYAENLNVLFCTSQRQSRPPKAYEVMLDSADGMDWESFCNCSLLFAVEANRLVRKRGQVSRERRNAIRDAIRDLFRLSDRD